MKSNPRNNDKLCTLHLRRSSQKYIHQFFGKDLMLAHGSESEKSIFKKNETEKEREIRLLENIYPRRIDPEYMHKICHLLKRKDAKYHQKRQHLNDTHYMVDENNNLYLTLLNFELSKKASERIEQSQIDACNKHNTVESKSARHVISLKTYKKPTKNRVNNETKPEEKSGDLKVFIPEFSQGIMASGEESLEKESNKHPQQLTTDDTKSLELNEQQKTALFEQLKTKHQLKVPHRSSLKGERKTIKINKLPLKVSKSSRNIFSNKDFSFVKNIHKLKEKIAIVDKFHLNQSKEPTLGNKSKGKLHSVDFFKYNRKKWEQEKKSTSEMILMNIEESKKRLRRQMSEYSGSLSELAKLTRSVKPERGSVKFKSCGVKKEGTGILPYVSITTRSRAMTNLPHVKESMKIS